MAHSPSTPGIRTTLRTRSTSSGYGRVLVLAAVLISLFGQSATATSRAVPVSSVSARHATTTLPASASARRASLLSPAVVSHQLDASLARYIAAPDSRPALRPLLHQHRTMYHTAVEAAQNDGPYRTTIYISGVGDVQRVAAMGATILGATDITATILTNSGQLSQIARLHYFPHNTDLVSNLQLNGRYLDAFAPAAQLVAASTLDSDRDGLTNLEEGWWCTDPNNRDSNSDGITDGAHVSGLIDWLRHVRSTRPVKGPPFAGWPTSPNNPSCLDAHSDSVPDAVDVYVVGLDPTTASTSHDRYSDGQKLFGTMYCPGGSVGCGYGPLADLPAWVKAPYDSPYVAAFPNIDVSVDPHSWHMQRVTVITTQKGQMTQAQHTYQTSVTHGESTSLANTATWNNWQEVSQAIETPLGSSPTARTSNHGQVVAPRDTRSRIQGTAEIILGGGIIFGSVAGAAAGCGLLGSVGGPIGALGAAAACESTIGTVGTAAGLKIAGKGWADVTRPDKAQSLTGVNQYSLFNINNYGSTSNLKAANILDHNVDYQSLASSLTGVQYAIDQQGGLISRGLQDVTYAIRQPRFTETHTNGRSYGGAQTTTTETSEQHTVLNGDAFTSGEDWSTAWAQDTSHAADLTFNYTIRNTGTDYAQEVSGLTFNIYLGNDTSPIISYPAYQQFDNGKLQNMFPPPGSNSSATYASIPVHLTLDQMRRIDEGEKLTIVPQTLSYGSDDVFYQHATSGGVTVSLDDGSDPSGAVQTYVLPIQGNESVQDVLTHFFPAAYDAEGNVNSLWVPQSNGSDPPVWKERFLSNIAWWTVYLSQNNANNLPLKDLPAQPGSSVLIRFDRDSDRDGYSDRTELRYHTNPNDPASHPTPEVLAGYVTRTTGNTATVELALQNNGTFDAYGVSAVMYAPDNSTTIRDNTIGGNGVVRAGAHVSVGSLIQSPNLVNGNWANSTAKPTFVGGDYTGSDDRVYTFTVTTAGVVGQGSTAIGWTDNTGDGGPLNLGNGYHTPLPLDVDRGLQIGFGTGSVAAGESFTVTALAPRDTFTYTINKQNYTPPVILVTYSDPQGVHRFITPIQLPSLDTDLSPYAGKMVKGIGLQDVTTDSVTTTASNLTNLVFTYPYTAPIKDAHLYLDFVSNGTPVAHMPFTTTIQSGPTVYPVSWSTSAFSQTYDPNADNILIASWTDAQGNIIASAARPLNTFANDPTPTLNTSSDTWNIGNVVQGAQPQRVIPIANTGLLPLNVTLDAPNPGVSLSSAGANGIITIPPASIRTVTATLDTSTLSNTVALSISLRSDDPAHPTIVMPISGSVVPTSESAHAFDVLGHPWDERVRVYGNVDQYTPITFTDNIQPDPTSVEPCKVFDASGTTLKGVGKYCTDFGNGTASSQMFGDGRDGDLTVGPGQTFYTDSERTSLTNSATGGQNALSVASTTGFHPGDEILVIQMQGVGAGTYEFTTVLGSNPGTPGTITLVKNLMNTYTAGTPNTVQVIRVPRFHNVLVQSGGVLTAHPWDGSTGGIVVLLSNGTTSINGLVSASGLGFRGQPGVPTKANVGRQGEGTGGPGGVQNYVNNGNGGGGGGYSTNYPWDQGNGGGGGANVLDNGSSGIGSGGGQNQDGPGGYLGASSGSTDLSTMTLGGAGGSGGNNNSNDASGASGNGGGIIIVSGATLNVIGAIQSNGSPGQQHYYHSGGGGSGAGGSVLVRGQTASLGPQAIVADGGPRVYSIDNQLGDEDGGHGGDGRVRVEYCNSASASGSTNPATTPVRILCYLLEKAGELAVQFTIPDQVIGGKNYLLQYGRHLSFAGAGSQLTYARVISQTYSDASMNALITNVGANGIANVSIDVGNDGTTDYTYPSPGNITQPTTLTVSNLAGAFNAYIASHAATNGYVDVPISVSVDGPADVVLTNLALAQRPATALTVGPGGLAVGCPGADTCSAVEGDTIPLMATVHNSGSQDAAGVVVGYFDGDPTQGGLLLGSSYIPSIAAGTAATTPFAWDTTGFTGTRTLYAVVDPLDGAGSVISRVLTIRTQPNLRVASITVDHPDALAKEPGNVVVTVANDGQADAAPSTTHVEVRGERGDTTLGNLSTPAVPAGGTVTVSLPFTPAAFGTHAITATANADGAAFESDRSDNTLLGAAYVGLGPQDIDAGGATDSAYDPSSGYGYLNGSTTDLSRAGTVTSTIRLNSTGPVQYRFDGMQPHRYYHLDATFYQQGNPFTQTAAFNGVDGEQVIGLDRGVAATASILVPTIAYTAFAGSPLTVTVQRASAGPALISRLALLPIDYHYVDAGGPDDQPYDATRGYGYLDPDAQTYTGILSGVNGPVSTYRTAFGPSVTYRFDRLDPAKRYVADLRMFAEPSSTQRQDVALDGSVGGGCANLPTNSTGRMQCPIDPALYANTGSVTVTVSCSDASCSPVVNELAIEQVTQGTAAPSGMTTATPTADATSTATVMATATPSTTMSSPTLSPTATGTNTPTATTTAAATNTPTGTAARTATATATGTSAPTSTNTALATNTPTSTSIATGTNTPTSTATATNTPSHMPTSTPTVTGIATATPTYTATPTNTPTAASASVTLTNVSPQGDSEAAGATFNPSVTVQTSGFSLDCSQDFLQNQDGNLFGAWPNQGCVYLGNNQYQFSFGTAMTAPTTPGVYHSQWQVWHYPDHVGPVIDLFFVVPANGSTTATPPSSVTSTPTSTTAPRATATPTTAPTNTGQLIPTNTPSQAPIPTATATTTAVPSNTATAATTAVPSNTATATTQPTSTATAVALPTMPPRSTATAQPTAVPSSTNTVQPTDTSIPLPTTTTAPVVATATQAAPTEQPKPPTSTSTTMPTPVPPAPPTTPNPTVPPSAPTSAPIAPASTSTSLPVTTDILPTATTKPAQPPSNAVPTATPSVVTDTSGGTVAPPPSTQQHGHPPTTRTMSLPLSTSRVPQQIVSGGTTTIQIHSVPRARIATFVQVMVQHVTVTGVGAHRRQRLRTQTLYRAMTYAVADKHGQFTWKLHVTYSPAKPMPVRLTITASMKGRTRASLTMTITLTPKQHKR